MKIKRNSVFLTLIIMVVILLISITYDGIKNYYIEALNKSNKYVYPCGNLIGIKAKTDGVLVIGYEDESLEYVGGIKKGDNIIKINEKKIENAYDIYEYIKDIKEDFVYLTVDRDSKELAIKVKLKVEGKEKRLGLWVRDKVSGVGTMTFYDPDNEEFRAIGHPIKDFDTSKILKIKEGSVYYPTEVNLEKSTESAIGNFDCNLDGYNLIGTFSKNDNEGIEGDIINNIKYRLPLIQVGSKKEIKKGKASILFENEEGYVYPYDINIENIYENKGDKNIVIEIVDEKLVGYTGGIVQGMSGAPIIQNNKLIGALTHVFEDNAKKGYGIFIDEMIELDKRN